MKETKMKKDRKLKWWHILLIVLGVLIIVAVIAAAVVWGQISDMTEDLGGNLGGEPTEIGGKITTVGKYAPEDTKDYVLCEYTELVSGENVILLKKPNELSNIQQKAHWVFVSDSGNLNYQYSGEYTGEHTPEAIKEDLFNVLKNSFGYSDEKLAKCDMVVYQPVSFLRVNISEVEITEDGGVTIKYSVRNLNGEPTAAYSLVGTYTKTENDFTFAFAELPEEERLRNVAEKLFTGAEYEYYSESLVWMNVLTFGDNYKVYLRG